MAEWTGHSVPYLDWISNGSLQVMGLKHVEPSPLPEDKEALLKKEAEVKAALSELQNSIHQRKSGLSQIESGLDRRMKNLDISLLNLASIPKEKRKTPLMGAHYNLNLKLYFRNLYWLRRRQAILQGNLKAIEDKMKELESKTSG